MTTVKFDELDNAYFFVEGSDLNKAYICRETGKILCGSDDIDIAQEEGPLPGDIDDEERYLPLPSQWDLDLGNELVFDFTEIELPERYDEVRAMFRKAGAYRRFGDLLDRLGKRDEWHRFRDIKRDRALREWCAENGIKIED